MRLAIAIFAALVLIERPALGQGTVFTYQGRLTDAGGPANGIYDLQFALMDAATGGGQVGMTLTNSPVTVSNGLFTVALDFGDGVFDGSPRWLEIGVRSNGSGGGFTVLVPRQAITAAPYAVTAGSLTGVVPLDRLPASVVTNNYAGPLVVGNSNGAHMDTVFSHSNVIVGAAMTNSAVAGSSILFPDQGGIAWRNGASIYDWGDHGNGNELQIIVGHGAALAAFGGGEYGRGFQMGGSGGFHDKFWFQYDTWGDAPGLGVSKVVEFVTRSGTENTYAYSAIRAMAADTLSGMNTLSFYSGDLSAVDNSGANLVGTMLTNGWNFYGGVTVTNITLGAVSVTQTNTGPIDPLTPKLWIDVTNNGAVYKMPLYQ